MKRLSGYDHIRGAAKKRLPRGIFDFVDGGAGGEVTVWRNRAAFARPEFDPRFLADVAERDTSTTVLGQKVAMPFLLAPAGLARLAHDDPSLQVTVDPESGQTVRLRMNKDLVAAYTKIVDRHVGDCRDACRRAGGKFVELEVESSGEAMLKKAFAGTEGKRAA